ncbi:MAG TPA: hypothetical protein VNI55_03720 [Gaiellaceae bacterium]|nr:hypothetical protein [Gaiellaceae bacterium]
MKALLLTLFTAGLMVSVAVAASPQDKGGPGKGKPEKGKPGAVASTTTGTTTGESEPGKGKGSDKARACKNARKLQFHGEFVAAGAGGFAMTVKKGNRHARALAGKQVSVLVDAKTRFHGKKRTLAALVAGDRLSVQASACKNDAAANTLLARKVGVKGAKSDAKDDEDDEDDDETTTGSTTTTSTTTATTTGS